jgi:hypothetical protein
MSLGDWYVDKEQCDRLAAEAGDQIKRAKYEEEARLWRDIARDIAQHDGLRNSKDQSML